MELLRRWSGGSGFGGELAAPVERSRLLCCCYVLGGDGRRDKLRKHQGKTTSNNDGDKRSSVHVRFPRTPRG